MVALNTLKFDKRMRPFPGHFSVKKITINDRDISDHWEQIDVFESIFSPTMSGRLTIIDSQNLIKNIPIIGEETVRIVIDDGLKTMDVTFKVYDITDRQHINHGVLKYVLQLCSEEYYKDAYIRISKSYHLKKFENNVREMLFDYKYLETKKTLVVGETKDVRSVIVPYWSPIHAITWMGCRAQAAEERYRGGNFIFFETIDGFKWVSVDNLLDADANQPYASLSYDPMRPAKSGSTSYDARNPDDTLRFEDWNVTKTFSILENARAGMYANVTRTIDLVNKTYMDTEYDYLKQFYEFPHLRGVMGASAKPLSSYQMDAVNYPDAHLRVAIKRKNLFTDEPDGNSEIEQWLPNKLSQMQQLENFKIQGQLPGHIGLTAGMIVEFNVPNPDRLSLNAMSGNDPSYSGQFLVTALRRTFQRDRFVISLEMVKDSRGSDLSGGM